MFFCEKCFFKAKTAKCRLTWPRWFLVIIHNYATVWTINQSKSLPGFLVVTSLVSMKGRLTKRLLRRENVSTLLSERQAISNACSCWNNFCKINCFRVNRKVIMWPTIGNGPLKCPSSKILYFLIWNFCKKNLPFEQNANF